ncbi:MAG: citrate/2-methylcitrate synthase, partial [Polyangiaceae bacterium]
MPPTTSTTHADTGLEGVVVAETRLSDVDGERGRLVIAGRDVEQLAGAVSFEEVCALLWGA